jgi:hypothetical protein
MFLCWRLLRIIGRRPFLAFGLVTFLVGALLATVHLTSRYALKLYVDDQLRRTPWDVVVYQRGIPGQTLRMITDQVATLRGIDRVERVMFLRALFPEGGEVVAEVDGRRLLPSWLCVLAASDLSILPPEVGFALGRQARDGAVLALTGPEQSPTGRAFKELQGAQDFSIQVAMRDGRRGLFRTPIRSVIRLERDELLRWLMDQTGSVSYVPHLGLFLLMPYREDVLRKFDTVANGFLPLEMVDPTDTEQDHVQRAEYYPEVMYLGRVDRARLLSGWDIAGSLARLRDVHQRLSATAADPREFTVDSTTEVLLERMSRIARVVGWLSILVALPLLWMAWMLAANLSALLMLNERRTLGLMRLRGAPGRLLGGALVAAIAAGGVLGATLGILAGSVGSLLAFERGTLPAGVLTAPEQVAWGAVFVLVAVGLALLVSRRLVRYATRISPLEASSRVAISEAAHAALTFGWLQIAAIVVGGYVLGRWVTDSSAAAWLGDGAATAERLLDFVGLPLLLYGLATLIASRPLVLQRVLTPFVAVTAGPLRRIVVRHTSVKPHRALAFLLVVALVSCVSLYPTVAGRSFGNRAERGARVELGADWQLIFNAPDVAGVTRLEGSVSQQLDMLRSGLRRLTDRIATLDGVVAQTYLVEAVLPRFYLPGYGLKGVPLYLVGDSPGYLARAYSEPHIGVSSSFDAILRRVANGDVAISPRVAEFWQVDPGEAILLGTDAGRNLILAKTSGTLAFLPGLPPRTVSDRQGYVQARVDYINHLFSTTSYVVGAADSPQLRDLQVLMSRVIVLVKRDEASADALGTTLVGTLPFTPLEARNLPEEISRLGTDMYVALALANMRIYMLGGLVLAVVAILAIGMTNYTEDRRTLGLLRLRGASPGQLWRFLLALLLSPALLGLLLGTAVALVAGFGLANYVWSLREIRTVVQYLPTRLVVSPLTGVVALTIFAMLIAITTGFSWWQYRRTVQESIRS